MTDARAVAHVRHGWGLITGEGGDRLIGIGWFDDARSRLAAGHNWMVWPTRREARAALGVVKGPVDRGRFPRARVVRVRLTVEVQ